MNPYINIIISTSAIYFLILLLVRIVGKTQFSQLSVTDLVFVLLISNGAQNAMMGSDSTLLGGVVAITLLFILNYTFKKIKYSSIKFRMLVEGEPVLLVHDGKIIENNCRKNNITIDQIKHIVREHDLDDIHEVHTIILEVDGDISVVSKKQIN